MFNINKYFGIQSQPKNKNDKVQQIYNPQNHKIERIDINVDTPQEYVCPITTQIIQNPVVAADGISYQKSSIELWLQKNNTSPFTGKILDHKILIPNYALKKAIATYKQKYLSHQPQKQSQKSEKKQSMRQFISKIRQKNDKSNQNQTIEQYKAMIFNLQRSLQEEKDRRFMVEMSIQELQGALDDLKKQNEQMKIKYQHKVGFFNKKEPVIIKPKINPIIKEEQKPKIDPIVKVQNPFYKEAFFKEGRFLKKQFEQKMIQHPEERLKRWARTYGIAEIGKWTKLDQIKQLNLARKNIKQIPQSIHCLTSLKHLNLSANNIQKIEHLELLPNLEELILNNNQIRKIQNLRDIRSLQKVYLHDNPATMNYPDYYQDLGTVDSLVSRGCAVYIKDWRNPQ